MEQSKIWDFFQNDANVGDLAFRAESRYRFLAARIKTGADVLNVGVGRGKLERLLIEKGAHLSCLDPNEKTIHALKEELGLGDGVRVGLVQEMPFEHNTFDFLVVSEVLEHLDDTNFRKALKEIQRVLKPFGMILGTVPADEQLEASWVVCPDCGKIFHRWGHTQSFSRTRLYSELSDFFSDIRIKRKYFSMFRSLNWKGRAIWIMKNVLIRIGFTGSLETFFFSARKPL